MMRCDECQHWSKWCFDNELGLCNKIASLISVYREDPETKSDFFCAGFEPKDNDE